MGRDGVYWNQCCHKVIKSKSLWQNVLHLFLGFVLMHCLSLSIRVSNELGLGHPWATKYSVYITVFQSLLIGILCMIIVLAVKNHLAIFFTNSKDLQQAVADLAWLLGITMLLNSVQPVISGIAFIPTSLFLWLEVCSSL